MVCRPTFLREAQVNAKQITTGYLHWFALVFEWASWAALDHLNTGAVHPKNENSVII